MQRDSALAFLRNYVKNENLVRHMLSVEAAMRWYARYYGEDEEKWALTGLLHDFDWEIHPISGSHPMLGLPILREAGISEEIVRAIASHADSPDFPRETLMEKALYACDEITGMITAVALVRPSRSLYDLGSSSVKRNGKISPLQPELTAALWNAEPVNWGLSYGSMWITLFMPCVPSRKTWI